MSALVLVPVVVPLVAAALLLLRRRRPGADALDRATGVGVPLLVVAAAAVLLAATPTRRPASACS